MTDVSMIATRRGEGGGFAILFGGEWYDITRRVLCAQSKVRSDLVAAADGVFITAGLPPVANPLLSGGTIVAQILCFPERRWLLVAPGWADAMAYFDEVA